MKTIISLCLLTLLSRLSAQEISWNISTSVVSEYLATIGLVPSSSPSFVNEVTGSCGDFYFGVWVATGLDHGKYGKTFKDDWDPYLGWGRVFGNVRYDVTGIYFLVADFSHINDDIWALDQKISLPKFPVVQPYVMVRQFGKVGSQSPNGGLFIWTGIQYECVIRKLTAHIDLSSAFSDGPLGKDPGRVFYKLSMQLSVPVSPHLTLKPVMHVQMPDQKQKRTEHAFNRKTEFVWGIAAVYSFGGKGGVK